MMRWSALLPALAAVAVASSAVAQNAGTVTRASLTSVGRESNGQARAAAVSADGRFVAFESDASDLVPNDTNGDSDVFVRDRDTGVLERVSTTADGSEAKGDSTCPALSADGRWVAFLSRASNMVAGSGNPLSRAMVYLHDRRDGGTVRISVAADGGLPDLDSECPSISDDGRRIVFASGARNLLATPSNEARDVYLHDRATGTTTRVSVSATGGDPNENSVAPAISGDGRFVAFQSWATDLLPAARLPVSRRAFAEATPQVYLRDLERGDTELVSVAHAHPLEAPNGRSVSPSISDDGRYVAFRTSATNLTATGDAELDDIVVRDRQTRTSWIASTSDALQSDCARDGQAFPCSAGSKGPPAISGDGRFVAFASRSLRHLPANRWHGDQIYLFDNQSRRLRRLSVDRTGLEGDACSWAPALSADGRLVAYASKSTLVPDDEGRDVDVFAQDWTCADGTCRALAACPARPAQCDAATSSVVRLRRHAPGGTHGDELYWRWDGAASASPFPDPTASARYQLCVYGGSLALDVATPDAPRCARDERPCWRSFAAGYKLAAPGGGLSSVTLARSGGGRRIVVRGGGPLLDAPYLPVAGSGGVVVQLQDGATGRCWGAHFPATAIRRNTAGSGPGSRGDGWLVADFAAAASQP